MKGLKFRFEKFGKNNVLLSVLMVLLGLVLFIWPGKTLTLAANILGIALLVGAVVMGVSWYRDRDKAQGGLASLATAILCLLLGLIVSVLPNDPGFAFGFTTVGLALGTFPVFFYKTDSLLINCVTVSVLTLLSFGLLQMICEKKAAGGLREAQTAATASAD